jgi:hypothetical protein
MTGTCFMLTSTIEVSYVHAGCFARQRDPDSVCRRRDAAGVDLQQAPDTLRQQRTEHEHA